MLKSNIINNETDIREIDSKSIKELPDLIEVAVPLPLYQTFTYKLPQYLKDSADIGTRVLAPFGRKRVTGYIVGFKNESNGYNPKFILDLLDDIPLFPPSMAAFFEWISNYYIYPIGEVIKTALPSGLDSHDISFVKAASKGIEDFQLNKLTPAETYVMDLILSQKDQQVTLKSLVDNPDSNSNISSKRKNGSSSVTHTLIRKMVKNGLIEIIYELKKDSANIKMEKFISISPSLDNMLFNKEDNVPSNKEDNVPSNKDKISYENYFNNSPEFSSLSKKRQEIIRIVSKHKDISLNALKKDVPTAPKLVSILAEQGYLSITEKQVFRDLFGDAVDPDTPPELTKEQAQVVNEVKENMIFKNVFQSYLLTGVTGSGKTEVYMNLVTEAVNMGKGAIILVPEISLISQTERRFRARFGKIIAVIHSGLSKGERLEQWHKIAKGEVSIVIGARSAIFSPVANLGIIIVDEEHDTSYKQESGLRYNARDLAVVRAKQNNITVILGSATPSMQSYHNVCNGKFKELVLKNRVNDRQLPEITLVDLKKYKEHKGIERVITPELSKEIGRCLKNGEQALIFLNRRGFSTFPVCHSCGESVKCKFCDVTLTLHKESSEFRCHLCGFSIASTVKTAAIKTASGSTFYSTTVASSLKCEKCGSPKIKPLGFGTEKIETVLKNMFPDARIIRLDQDTSSKKGSTVQILKKVRNRTVDIIVGTQMLAKGHDFPAITLVGVICADLSLNFPDFRSSERTFQLLAQVAGRAGRGEKPGKVIMQTYNPEHFSIEASKNQDFMQFYYSEIPFRQALSYPPFSRIIQLKISGLNMEKVRDHAAMAGSLCQEVIDKYNSSKVQMLGPIEAGIPKISMRYRWQIVLKSSSAAILNKIVKYLIKDTKAFANKDISIGIDVDPYFMM